MAKHNTSLKDIYKIESSRFKNYKYKLNLTIPDAKDNKEIVSLAESQVLRFLKEINEQQDIEEDIKNIKKSIGKLKSKPNTSENRKEIKEKYKLLNDALLIKDYICVIMNSNKSFDIINKGIELNGKKFKRLTATTGGSKKSTIIYSNEEVYNEIYKRLHNGRNIDKPLVAGKLEAYLSLACSATIPVSYPKGILVVDDCVTNFKSNIIEIDDTGNGEPKLSYIENHEIELIDSDGYGIILATLGERWSLEIGLDYIISGVCIRNSFCKGMLFVFEFNEFADKYGIQDENGEIIVKDAWGDFHNIKNIEMILTTSMLKLWDSYNSIDHYLSCCKENGYTFAIAKTTPKQLENERYLNYQFIQSLKLNDSDIDELIKPTVDEIKDILSGDYRKTLLFLRGIHLSEDTIGIKDKDYDFAKALMIDKKMMDDPFVKHRTHDMIKKRISDAKKGDLKVKGNFQIVSGDPVSLIQSVLGLEVKGLLKAGEFYSDYWNQKSVDKVACFRAPMTCHNNIRILNMKNSDEMSYWYKYMNNCLIFNSWDTTAHALNGLDKDADSCMTTNNPVILRGINELPAILCVQKVASKKVVTEEDLIQANKNSFGDEIGAITNRITTMFNVQSLFSDNSEEYKTLEYRIMCGQNYQQNAIDKIKGIVSKPMPKEWFDYTINKILPNDSEEIKLHKEFNMRILADKKPYFFNYVYPHQMREYKVYIDSSEKKCLINYRMSIKDLKLKEYKTDDEINFLYYYDLRMPVNINPSIMNKIAWKIEKEFDDIFKEVNCSGFDSNLLKSDFEYDIETYNKVKVLYQSYQKELGQFIHTNKNTRFEKDEKKSRRDKFQLDFKEQAYSLCNNKYELCNILIDLCYTNTHSKQFAWDVVGDVIIENLLSKNNNTISYPTLDESGEIEYAGYNFTMKSILIESEVK